MQFLINLRNRLGRIKGRWRTPFLALALGAFALGSVLSFSAMDIAPQDIAPAPLLLLLLVLSPLSIAYSTVNMLLMARATKVRIRFIEGANISAWAQLTEMLPIPGAAIVRTGALVARGVPTTRSAEIVLACSLLWVAMGAFATGLALADSSPIAILLALGAGASTIAVTIWIAHRFGIWIALVAAALRLLGLALFAWRLAVCFAALGVPVSAGQSLVFAFASILGGAASIIPAGLGVSEGLSALLAAPLGIAAGAAFLAVAIARMAGLMANLVLAAALFTIRGKPAVTAELAGQGS